MRYPGGKGKTYQHVINLMPPHRVYIETHLGGGSVMRNKLPAERNVGIDADDRVISAWLTERRPGLELLCEQAEDVLARLDFRGDELVYVDPPFHPATRRRQRVYRHDYTESDHRRLLLVLRSLPCMVIVSGYANALYDTMLSGWGRRTFLAKTHADVREETMWFNFEPPKVLHDSRFVGDDFRERQTRKRRFQRLQERVHGMDPVERSAFTQWLNEAYPVGTRSASS